jgi:hypothetical protein
MSLQALNRLAKWRSVFAGWQLGTRGRCRTGCQAVRDHREVTILLRAEVNALTGLLIAKGIFTAEEFAAKLDDEADALSAMYERKFPGMRATDDGIHYSMPEVFETMKGWRP